jgi:hypothetical protein
MENGILYAVRILRIPSNTVRANQRPNNLPGNQPRHVMTLPEQDIYMLSRRYPSLLKG